MNLLGVDTERVSAASVTAPTVAVLAMTPAELLQVHGLALTRFAYMLTCDRGHAEDLVQDVMVGMYRRFGDRPIDVAAPVAYARRALVNASVSRTRRARVKELVTDRVPERAAYDCDPAQSDGLWQLLKHLSPRARTVLFMRFHFDASDIEIAEVVGCRQATVRSIASRALADLRTTSTLGEPS